jgi:hypothetical protein
VSSQDQNRPTMQIHELLNPKQTHIMWTSKTKTNFNYAFPKVKWEPHYAYLWTLTIKSNVHYVYLWVPKPNQILIICIICELPRPKLVPKMHLWALWDQRFVLFLSSFSDGAMLCLPLAPSPLQFIYMEVET